MSPELRWFEGPGTPDDLYWWAVEHTGHPAFYLRALMPGDFNTHGSGPNKRHAMTLEGEFIKGAVKCGTCNKVPRPIDLEPIERITGEMGHLDIYRAGRVPWPPKTKNGTCWNCSNPADVASKRVELAQDHKVSVCVRCLSDLKRRGYIEAEKEDVEADAAEQGRG